MTHDCKQNRNKIKQQASEHKCPKTTSNKTYTKTMRLRVILFNQSLEVVEHRWYKPLKFTILETYAVPQTDDNESLTTSATHTSSSLTITNSLQTTGNQCCSLWCGHSNSQLFHQPDLFTSLNRRKLFSSSSPHMTAWRRQVSKAIIDCALVTGSSLSAIFVTRSLYFLTPRANCCCCQPLHAAVS